MQARVRILGLKHLSTGSREQGEGSREKEKPFDIGFSSLPQRQMPQVGEPGRQIPTEGDPHQVLAPHSTGSPYTLTPPHPYTFRFCKDSLRIVWQS
jgi:hypothetical protein